MERPGQSDFLTRRAAWRLAGDAFLAPEAEARPLERYLEFLRAENVTGEALATALDFPGGDAPAIGADRLRMLAVVLALFLLALIAGERGRRGSAPPSAGRARAAVQIEVAPSFLCAARPPTVDA
jgi:hypothetical protein